MTKYIVTKRIPDADRCLTYTKLKEFDNMEDAQAYLDEMNAQDNFEGREYWFDHYDGIWTYRDYHRCDPQEIFYIAIFND